MDTWIDKPTAGSTIISIEADIQTDIIKELQQTPLPQKNEKVRKSTYDCTLLAPHLVTSSANLSPAE